MAGETKGRGSAQERARALARGKAPGRKAATGRERGIPLVGDLASPGAPGSGIAGAGAVEDENRVPPEGPRRVGARGRK